MKTKIFLLILFFLIINPVMAEEMTAQEKVDYYAQQQEEAQNKTSTLSDTLKYFDTLIVLNEKDTANIETTLEKVTKQSTESQEDRSPFYGLSWSTFLAYPIDSIKYVYKNIVSPEKEVVLTEEEINAQKEEIVNLSERLVLQKKQIDALKVEKTYLLTLTQNDEAKYQALLEASIQELEAQQAIYSGKSKEFKVGSIKEGVKIGSMISGVSACSTGTHLHFEIHENSRSVNPANYLSKVQLRWTMTPLSEVNFIGKWTWPVKTPAVLTQEYGMSWFAKPGGYSTSGSYAGSGHSGMDMVSESGDLSVYSPVTGTLYKGSISCGGGSLSYMKVIGSNNIAVYFLHAIEK